LIFKLVQRTQNHTYPNGDYDDVINRRNLLTLELCELEVGSGQWAVGKIKNYYNLDVSKIIKSFKEVSIKKPWVLTDLRLTLS